jgi:hypothetical protein
MRKIFIILGIFFISFVFCINCPADKKEKKVFDDSEKVMKAVGEVISVETGIYCFTIRDDSGAETKFFAPRAKLMMVKEGEKIQVNYRKTTDGKYKALGIKNIKERKKKKINKETGHKIFEHWQLGYVI